LGSGIETGFTGGGGFPTAGGGLPTDGGGGGMSIIGGKSIVIMSFA